MCRIELCPYCQKRQRKIVTCGDKWCQGLRDKEYNRNWYINHRREKGAGYRSGFRSVGAKDICNP